MEFKKLNNGVKIPSIGYGVYQTPKRRTEELVFEALNLGYRHIDTAQNYSNEKEVGIAIKKANISRDEVFVTTKTQTTGYDSTVKSIKNSLNEFGYDYFDLILIHWPNGDNIGTYNALEYALDEGMARAIGVSNFNSSNFKCILENCDVKPVVNQIETHVLWQQKSMHEFLTQNDCIHESWSPFASGNLNVFDNDLLVDLGQKYGKSVAQIILRFLIQSDIVAIPKSSSSSRMAENLNVFDFKLDDNDLFEIQKLDERQSYCNWPYSMQEEAQY
ncbi:aldo/keto reductase [Methanobrevibacter sp.]|uniref:aldo/keto reductase n=1 Tax=Methanobrevibacter sp. TaxID=66852 RepID=UPI00388F8771